MVKVTLHPHALQRLKERGATKDEVLYTVRHGNASPAKFRRTRFTHTFAYNRKCLGTAYRSKLVEAFAAKNAKGNWLVVTVIVKFK